MKKLLCLLFLFWLCGTARAQIFPVNKLEVGPESEYIVYKEPNWMRNNGWMHGLAGAYTYHGPLLADNEDSLKVMARLEMRGVWGKLDYESNGTGDMKNDEYFVFETRGLAGYDLYLGGRSAFTPFTGFGFRRLINDSGGTQTTTGAAGYDRRIDYYYIPLGGVFTLAVRENFRAVLSSEYDFLIKGQVRSNLSDADPGYNDIVNTQKKGSGWRVALTLEISTEKYCFALTPFYRYWSFQSSKKSEIAWHDYLVAIGTEPRNTTRECGIALTVGF